MAASPRRSSFNKAKAGKHILCLALYATRFIFSTKVTIRPCSARVVVDASKRKIVIKHNVLLMLSGGVGSAIAAAYLLEKGYAIPAAVFVNRGQISARPERIAAEAIAQYLGIKLVRPQFLQRGLEPFPEEVKEQIGTPGRNANVAVMGIPFAFQHECSFLAFGNTTEDTFPDSDLEFRNILTQMASHMLAMDFTVAAPLADWRNMARPVALRWMYESGHAKRMLPMAWSCWWNDIQQCGTCGACLSRRKAFCEAGITDPAVYKDAPPLS